MYTSQDVWISCGLRIIMFYSNGCCEDAAWFASLGNGDEMPPPPQRGEIVDEGSDKETRCPW